MELIADILLVAGALGAGLYCFVLARRLKRFTDLEKGVGGAVSVLSVQADELKASLEVARSASDQSGKDLRDLTDRAEAVAQRLELMLASMHDIIPPAQEPHNIVVETENAPAPDAVVKQQADDPVSNTDPVSATSAPIQAKAPNDLMFFRHARSAGAAE